VRRASAPRPERHLKATLLFIPEADVRRLLDLDRLLDRLAAAFVELSAGRASVPPRIAARSDEGLLATPLVREVLTGTTLAAATLPGGDAGQLRALLAPAATLGLPILGVVSDAQKSIRLAVAALFPEVPHQLCHFHFLRDIALPTTTADRALKTDLKKEVRGIHAVEARVAERTDDEAAVITGYTTALRTVLLEDGRPPLDLPGVAIYEDLAEISASLSQCVAKRGTLCSNVCSM